MNRALVESEWVHIVSLQQMNAVVSSWYSACAVGMDRMFGRLYHDVRTSKVEWKPFRWATRFGVSGFAPSSGDRAQVLT